jgi:hypothetical protein
VPSKWGTRTWPGGLEAGFRPEYRVAFDAWIKTDPFKNPLALPGPMFMPEYHVSSSEQGAKESLKRNRYSIRRPRAVSMATTTSG